MAKEFLIGKKSIFKVDQTKRYAEDSKRKITVDPSWIRIARPASILHGSSSESPLALELTFADISYANDAVGDATNFNDWNTFFDLPTYGNPFTSVVIDGNKVSLYGGSNITTKFGLFYNNNGLQKIYDYAGCIIIIGDNAFGYQDDNGDLLEVYMPEVVETINEDCGNYSAFGGAYNLTYAYLPKLKILGGNTFYDCNSLVNLTLSWDEITEVNCYEFYGCESLPTVYMPNLVNANGYGSFTSCNLFTEINFPKLEYTDTATFDSCTSATSINLPLLVNAGAESFFGVSNVTDFNFPLLETIGNNCFAYCTSVTLFTFPSITNLGSSCIYNGVFAGILGNTIIITITPAIISCDGGGVDEDIEYLDAHNAITVITV